MIWDVFSLAIPATPDRPPLTQANSADRRPPLPAVKTYLTDTSATLCTAIASHCGISSSANSSW